MVFYKAIPTKFNNLRVLINYLNLLSNKPREKVWCPKWIGKAKFHSEKGSRSHYFFSHINILQDQYPPRKHTQKCQAHRSGTPFSTPGVLSSPKQGSAWRLTGEPCAFLREEVCLWTLNTTTSSFHTWKWNRHLERKEGRFVVSWGPWLIKQEQCFPEFHVSTATPS